MSFFLMCTAVFLICCLEGDDILLNVHSCISRRTLTRGGSRGGGGHPAPPLKLEKIWFYGVKSCFFLHEMPQTFSRPPPLGAIFTRKNWKVWRYNRGNQWHLVASVVLIMLQTWQVKNEERTGLRLRPLEHIRFLLWHDLFDPFWILVSQLIVEMITTWYCIIP
jgi:hypothetical protein